MVDASMQLHLVGRRAASLFLVHFHNWQTGQLEDTKNIDKCCLIAVDRHFMASAAVADFVGLNRLVRRNSPPLGHEVSVYKAHTDS